MDFLLEKKSIDAIRILAADSIQKANSGHPGLPLGAAPMAYELWAHHMKHNPKNPQWINRDRFILSSGHGSMLLYSLLHLFGYGLTVDDLQEFRQWGSQTPGHPEYGHTIGVEATTGPLGAGMAMAVGMAMAEAHLAEIFNMPDYPVIDHFTYVLGGDGCLMEGISYEAFSLAGTLGLHKLIVLYDSNHMSIEGHTDIAFTENVQKRMEALGFQTLTVEDGNDIMSIGKAIELAKSDIEHPSFITVKTTIGYGCPEKQGHASAHGEPLGKENVNALRKFLDWEDSTPFYIPSNIYTHYHKIGERGEIAERDWEQLFNNYCKKYPDKKNLWEQYFGLTNKEHLRNHLYNMDAYWKFDKEPQSTRNISGIVINRLKDEIPTLIGGSADLAPSTKTYMNGEGDFTKEQYSGRNLHFGVRELAMSAIANGLALHGGCLPYIATFFVFSDYTKPMIRLASLMKLPIIYIFTHDSIGVGEDGATHEPIEQLAMLRSIPNLHVFRPADAIETAAAWFHAIASPKTPTALVLSRQNLPQLAASSKEALKGGYILEDSSGNVPDVLLIASGSEVHLAVETKKLLKAKNIDSRVVSMPSMEVFELQSDEYKERVLPNSVRNRVSIEALSSWGWGKYVGLDGISISMNHFGASAPSEILFENYGFTPECIADKVVNMLNERKNHEVFY